MRLQPKADGGSKRNDFLDAAAFLSESDSGDGPQETKESPLRRKPVLRKTLQKSPPVKQSTLAAKKKPDQEGKGPASRRPSKATAGKKAPGGRGQTSSSEGSLSDVYSEGTSSGDSSLDRLYRKLVKEVTDKDPASLFPPSRAKRGLKTSPLASRRTQKNVRTAAKGGSEEEEDSDLEPACMTDELTESLKKLGLHERMRDMTKKTEGKDAKSALEGMDSRFKRFCPLLF
ncbi:hypothetical protein AAG570_002189 [Ranatra chinensis]|uniref:Uncharacterized protein n=1 Tax=Ranatra chinensis TaxID=642074 RepID=A0ABD0Y6T3_9HEMI